MNPEDRLHQGQLPFRFRIVHAKERLQQQTTHPLELIENAQHDIRTHQLQTVVDQLAEAAHGLLKDKPLVFDEPTALETLDHQAAFYAALAKEQYQRGVYFGWALVKEQLKPEHQQAFYDQLAGLKNNPNNRKAQHQQPQPPTKQSQFLAKAGIQRVQGGDDLFVFAQECAVQAQPWPQTTLATRIYDAYFIAGFGLPFALLDELFNRLNG